MANIREIDSVIRKERVKEFFRLSLFILLMFFTVGIASGQSPGGRYVLYKGGDSIQQKAIFLLLDADSVQIIEEGSEKAFQLQRQLFQKYIRR